MTTRPTATEANRLFYANAAHEYDAKEPCVADDRLRFRLSSSLDEALALVDRKDPLAVLDACGGSGNASLMLLERGLLPVTIDISPEMLGIYITKATARGYEPQCTVSDVWDFLGDDDRQWDLIVFSSALHHLEMPTEVLRAALARLRAGGCVITAFDPRAVGLGGRVLRKVDYAVHLLLHKPQHLAAVMKRRLGRDAPGAETVDVGSLAERHAMIGLDDNELRRAVEASGCKVASHDQYYEGRFSITRRLLRRLKEPTTFGFVIHRPRSF